MALNPRGVVTPQMHYKPSSTILRPSTSTTSQTPPQPRKRRTGKFQNIFLFSKTDYNKDTLEIYLCDNAGKWYGKGWGDVKEVTVEISNINDKM